MADNLKMAKGTDLRDDRITIRLPSSLRQAIQREADRDRRTLADMIVIALEARFAKRSRKARRS